MRWLRPELIVTSNDDEKSPLCASFKKRALHIIPCTLSKHETLRFRIHIFYLVWKSTYEAQLKKRISEINLDVLVILLQICPAAS